MMNYNGSSKNPLGTKRFKCFIWIVIHFFRMKETKVLVGDLAKLHRERDMFDFSNLNKEHILYNSKTEKAFGVFGTETPDTLMINEYAALRSKAYSYM